MPSFLTLRFYRKHCAETPAFLGLLRSFTVCGASPLKEWAIRGSVISRRWGVSPKGQRPQVLSRWGSIRCTHCLAANQNARAPYHPSDRRFLDPLAIDTFALPAPLLTVKVCGAIERALSETSRLSAMPFVDYTAVATLKNLLFDAAHAAFRDLAKNHPSDLLVEDFRAFAQAGGETLRRFAIFSAIEARFQATLEKFPMQLKSPSSAGIANFAAAHEEAISRAPCFCNGWRTGSWPPPTRAGGLELGLYRDLAVGCAPDGAEAWAEAELLTQGYPSERRRTPSARSGQVWNLPPTIPARSRGEALLNSDN